ncbi:hypothetical protein [Sphingobium sp. MK2]|uniref:hypothetical protein n=1 Tax=Sphingobium sp. MK2 TaxID=3116540 RepID=UPI0032E35B40
MSFEGKLLKINPKQSFPFGAPFEIKDGFNGPIRGTWWYRDRHTGLQGPFKSQFLATNHQQHNGTVHPWQDATRMWWWTDPKGNNHGPFIHLAEADAFAVAYWHNEPDPSAA